MSSLAHDDVRLSYPFLVFVVLSVGQDRNQNALSAALSDHPADALLLVALVEVDDGADDLRLHLPCHLKLHLMQGVRQDLMPHDLRNEVPVLEISLIDSS